MVNIYIRVDGSMQVGMGHLVRCIALAQMIKNDFTVHFACMEIPEQTKVEVSKNRFELLLLNDEEQFFSFLTAKDIAILDGYNFDFAYQEKVKATGAKLVCIDDMHNQPFASDCIINHAPGVAAEQYTAQPSTIFALGPQYALLRPAFIDQAKNKRTVTKNESLFICFGGGDFKNLTYSTLQTILAAKRFQNITVVTGPAYNFLESLQPLIAANKNVHHHHAVSEEQMLSLMIASDVAIVPTSGILYEVLCAGCKIIAGTYVDNQQLIYEAFKKAGAFISAGNFSAEEINIALQQLDDFVPVNNLIIDGLSPKRIVAALYDVALTVRKATAADCQLLFDWANDSDVRKNAINKESIKWEGHVKWFSAKLQSSHTKIFILEYNGEAAGQVRYDFDGVLWVIDYSIDKKYRGKGFGKAAIDKTLNHFTGSEIKAMVLKENTASSATFEKLHFLPQGNTIIEGQSFLVYKFLA